MGVSENGSQNRKLKVSYFFYLAGEGHGCMETMS